MAVDSADADALYVGTYQGTLVSRDGGKTLELSSAPFESGKQGASRMWTVRSRPGRVYAAAVDGGLFEGLVRTLRAIALSPHALRGIAPAIGASWRCPAQPGGGATLKPIGALVDPSGDRSGFWRRSEPGILYAAAFNGGLYVGQFE